MADLAQHRALACIYLSLDDLALAANLHVFLIAKGWQGGLCREFFANTLLDFAGIRGSLYYEYNVQPGQE